jgi:hypothetical protein
MLLKRIINRISSSGLDSFGSECGTLEFPCEHGNEPLGFLKLWKFLDKLNEYEFLDGAHQTMELLSFLLCAQVFNMKVADS